MIGMLWFDNEPKKSLDEKIADAAIYYRQKYGLIARYVLVHPSMIPARPKPVDAQPEEEYRLGDILVQQYKSLLPNHLWVCSDQPAHHAADIAPSKP